MRQLREVALPNAQENLAQAEATLATAEVTFDRTEKLHATGFATTAQLDNDRRDRDVARTRVRAARLEVASNQPGGSDYTIAEQTLAEGRANLRSAETRLGYTRIAAPRDGILIFRNVERGDVVQPGRVLMTLSPATEVQLVVAIDEKNLGLLAEGDHALASADAYPDRTFAATLTYINPGVDLQRASVEVKLTVAPSDIPDYLRQDMTVSVDIEVGRKAGATVLPVRLVHDIEGTAPWVMAIRDGHAHRQPVRVGLRGTTDVEIVEGLAPGQAVIAVGTDVAEGQRVRAAAS
jgi:HlyD family secretion protein